MAQLTVNFLANTTGIQAGLSRVQAGISKLKSSAGNVASAFAKVAAPITGLGGLLAGVGIGAAVMDVLDYGGALADLSNITDVAISDLVTLQEEFRQNGIEASTLQQVLAKMSATLENPSPKVVAVLKSLNLSLADLKSMGIAEAFNTIGSAIGGLDSPTKKIAMSQMIFGKSLGSSLVNLFKTGDAAKDAKEYVGQLGATMEKNAAAFDRAGDIIAGANTKVRQFFAAFVGANIERLTEITDALAKLDLTNVGASFGETADKIITTLIEAFKQGRLWDTLWNGFSATIRKTGELLISVFELAAQHFGRAFEDTLRGSKLGWLAGIAEDQVQTFTNPKTGKEMKAIYRQYLTPQEKIADIMARNKNALGGDDAIKRFFDPLKSASPKISGADAAEAIFKNLPEIDVRGAMLGNSLDLLMTKGIKRVPVSKSTYHPDAFKPVVSSLARIGGASVFTRSPLVSMQKRANQLLETIASNTAKGRDPVTGMHWA